MSNASFLFCNRCFGFAFFRFISRAEKQQAPPRPIAGERRRYRRFRPAQGKNAKYFSARQIAIFGADRRRRRARRSQKEAAAQRRRSADAYEQRGDERRRCAVRGGRRALGRIDDLGRSRLANERRRRGRSYRLQLRAAAATAAAHGHNAARRRLFILGAHAHRLDGNFN